MKMQEACLTNYQYFFFVIEQSINSSDLLDNFNFLLHKPLQGIGSDYFIQLRINKGNNSET